MSNNILSHAPSAPGTTRRGLAGLLTLGITLAVAAGALGTRTWHVGSGLGSALFPVEDVIELAAVAFGTAVAGWIGLHALVALACVVASRRGLRWSAGERTVERHAPATVRRLARAAVGTGIGLALTTPTALASPDRTAGDPDTGDAGPAVVLDLGWRPTAALAEDQNTPGARAPGQSAASDRRSAPDRASLVNQGARTGGTRERAVVVEPGDTLWAIAADQLAGVDPGTDPSDADIAAAVPRWHQANRKAVGADPDLIHPGTVLHRP